MNSAYYRKLIYKQLNGTINREEQEILDHWYELYETETPYLSPGQIKSIKVRQRIFFNRYLKKKVTSDMSFLWKYAAVIGLLFTVSFLLFQIKYQQKPILNSLEEIDWQEIITVNKIRKRIILPDKSTVYLQGNSSLKFAANFQTNRTVHLKGQAFFDIVPHVASPFVVMADGVAVTVLGTSFTVNAKKEAFTTVAILTGKVSVNDSHSSHYLIPKEKISIDHLKGTFTKDLIDIDKEFAWTKGEIIFDHTPIKLAIDELVEWYDIEQVEWQMDPHQYACTVTGKYQYNSLVEILESISYAISLEYKIDHKKLIISAMDCS
ncbi:FecR family protein [Anditalea andensis]|uniref:Uncharacterized protein n=1 Tax=Anditalea andensis TaxID=1048983 RepID=A0A074KPQ2_9BACT|nr:FecR family protein [Anditalea andensis]KEO71936.1 hypothetical protein EL17_20685 [Anditalea andensis]